MTGEGVVANFLKVSLSGFRWQYFAGGFFVQMVFVSSYVIKTFMERQHFC